ncbi:hypothetical protein ACMD2_23500 [Ananas comosus]|uniref:Uncharacterized protein n=1 Tax=Ananas comosus TaxID=4615 RepID=A0A199VG85_ANACO|nr:hypothetical protein ACMD2_23500 [Ananas comosus]
MPPPRPNYEFQEWWNRERDRLLSPEPPSSSSPAASGAGDGDGYGGDGGGADTPTAAASKWRGRSAGQISGLLLLRLRRPAATAAGLPLRLLSLVATAARRVSSARARRSHPASLPTHPRLLALAVASSSSTSPPTPADGTLRPRPTPPPTPSRSSTPIGSSFEPITWRHLSRPWPTCASSSSSSNPWIGSCSCSVHLH